MGEPASLTADERQYVADLADHVIGETERDGASPFAALAQFASARPMNHAWSLLAMAQEIRRLREEVERLTDTSNRDTRRTHGEN